MICFNLKHRLGCGKMVKKKGPKTLRGSERKLLTGDGRKSVSKYYFGEKKKEIGASLR